MTETPSWHEEARRLLNEGKSVAAIARAVGRGETTVRVALDINGARAKQLAVQREHRRRERETIAGTRVRIEADKPGRGRNDQRITERAYADATPQRPLTLPHISLSALPEEPAVRKFAPRTRLAATGADRWREIHESMKRRGLISEPGLPEQPHH